MAVPDKEGRPAAIQLRNLMLATDLAADSATALTYAAVFARRYGSKLYLADLERAAESPLFSFHSIVQIIDRITRGSERRLRRLQNAEQIRGIPSQLVILSRPLGSVLSEVVKQYGIDLIVCPNNGGRGFKRFLARPDAQKFLCNSRCPLLSIGPRARAPMSASLELRHILYPADLSQESSSAASYATLLATQYATRLTMLHVLREPSTAKLYRLLKEELEDEMQRLIPPEVRPWCNSEKVIDTGEPAQAILHRAKAEHVDLIVLGISQAKASVSGMDRNLADHVIAEAECPVLIVPNEFPKRADVPYSAPVIVPLPAH